MLETGSWILVACYWKLEIERCEVKGVRYKVEGIKV